MQTLVVYTDNFDYIQDNNNYNYVHSIYRAHAGADPGGVIGTPFQSVLILKQALKIIILIGAKIIIDLLYYKAQEPVRLCLGIHIQTMH